MRNNYWHFLVVYFSVVWSLQWLSEGLDWKKNHIWVKIVFAMLKFILFLWLLICVSINKFVKKTKKKKTWNTQVFILNVPKFMSFSRQWLNSSTEIRTNFYWWWISVGCFIYLGVSGLFIGNIWLMKVSWFDACCGREMVHNPIILVGPRISPTLFSQK